MESAPRDGTHILLYISGHWIEGYYEIEYGGYWNTMAHLIFNLAEGGPENDEPTAWAPLPIKGK